MSPLLRSLLERAFGWAIRPAPREYRDLVAVDARETFLIEAERVRTERGPWAFARYTARTLAGFVVTSWGERISALRGLRMGELFADVRTDARVAVRSLSRAPAFSVAVILTLSVGLGGSTAILGLMNTVYRSALPFTDAEELVRLRSYANAASGQRLYNMSPKDFLTLREGSQALAGVVAMDGGSVSIVGDDGATRVSAISVSEGWGDLLGVRPIAGRHFTAEEESAGADARVVLISHSVWDRFFGRDPGVVGRTLNTTSGPLAVVGVMEAGFAYPYSAGVWTPGRFDPSEWRAHDLNVVARLAPGTSIEQATADAERVFGALKQSTPGTTPDDGVSVVLSRDDLIRDSANSLRGLAAAVIALLLLACANVANLLTIRLVDREADTTLRAVLGASRSRLVRLAMVESAVLFLAGGVGSIALAAVLGRSAGALIPNTLRDQLLLDRIQLEPTVLLGAMGIALLAGLITGGVAALRASKSDLQSALRNSGRGSPNRATGRLQNLLVVSEVSLALVLLVGASVLFQHFQSLRTADLGYQTDERVTLQLVVDTERYAETDARAALYRTLEENIRALPEVVDVGITSVNPLCCGDWAAPIAIEGLERPDDAPPLLVHHGLVTPTYFDALAMPVVRGRNFGPEDTPEAPPVVVVDEALAARFWPGEDPLGKRLGLARPGEEMRTVIGVVSTATRQGDYTESWYVPLYQDPTGRSAEIIHVVLHQRADGALRAARQVVAEIDPALATFGEATLTSLREEAIGQDRLGAVLAGLFAGIGLLLACLGLYGLLAYRVALQTREIGTRLALGARGSQVVMMVLGRSMRLLGWGVLAGAVVSWLLNRVLIQAVPGVQMAGAGVVAVLVGVVCVATLVAALVPAIEAARLDPARTVQG